MATRRRAKNGDSHWAWAATALTGVGLIVGGFLAGVLIGVVTEEPRVLTQQLTGRSERVDWSAATASAPSEEAPAAVRAPAPTPAPKRASPQRLAASAPPPAADRALPAVSAAPSGFSVQIGAVSSSEAARAMEEKLEAKGYESFITAGVAARDSRWRVRVGPFATRDEASHAAARLERNEGLATWVVSPGS